MNWPIGHLLLVLGIAVGAALVPWWIPRGKLKRPIAFLVAGIATLLWVYYEVRLQSLSKPGDPLIRVDLFWILPLIMLDWISAAIVAFKHSPNRNIDARSNQDSRGQLTP